MNSPSNNDVPYFSFNFMKYFTHDFLTVPKDFDIQLKNIIEYFEEQKYLDNTLFIVMSDHGSRLTKYSYQSKVGKMERSLPFFSMRLPKNLHDTEFHRNAIANKDKLFTAHDVYKTLKQFYYINRELESLHDRNGPIYTDKCRGNFANSQRKIRQLRGISLFEKHPENRTCFDALIPMLFCVNTPQQSITDQEFFLMTGHVILDAAQFVLEYVIEKTNSERSKCEIYELNKIISMKMLSGSYTRLYVLNVQFKPDNAIFEAYLRLNSEKNFKIYNRVIRLNKYGTTSNCMSKNSLMGFCFCK